MLKVTTDYHQTCQQGCIVGWERRSHTFLQ